MKRRRVFTNKNLKIIRKKIEVSEINSLADILCNMKKMSYHIVTYTPRCKYIETIINTPSQDELVFH